MEINKDGSNLAKKLKEGVIAVQEENFLNRAFDTPKYHINNDFKKQQNNKMVNEE